jgi:glycosyltransferase involved in cell wall biosynthesis
MTMGFLFYDNVVTGHHLGYVAGIIGAAQEQGIDSWVAAAEMPKTLRDAQLWIPVDSHPRRSVLANRGQLRRATQRASGYGATTLIDLYLDHQIWVAGSNTLPESVHVLHHAEQYDLSGRSAPAAASARYLRRRLARLTARRSGVVVHTPRSAQLIQDLVPPDRLFLAGYPVLPLSGRKAANHPRSERPTVLFVGAGRAEKGLDLLFEAVSELSPPARLWIVGRQVANLRSSLSQQYPGVDADWLDEFVSDETLHQAYATADLAVLPYRSTFGRHGGPSSVLLEMISAGLPLVTTPALAGQVPAGYGGAIVAGADTAEALTHALDDALRKLETLSTKAKQEGPRFIGEHHTFDAYVRRLIEAARSTGG